MVHKHLWTFVQNNSQNFPTCHSELHESHILTQILTWSFLTLWLVSVLCFPRRCPRWRQLWAAAVKWAHESGFKEDLFWPCLRGVFIVLGLNKGTDSFRFRLGRRDWPESSAPGHKMTKRFWDRPNFSWLTFKKIESSKTACARLTRNVLWWRRRGDLTGGKLGHGPFADNEGCVYANLPPELLFCCGPQALAHVYRASLGALCLVRGAAACVRQPWDAQAA